MDKNIRIDEIVTRLNAASDAYYGGQEEQMTNYEWDALFDELTALEKATGYVRPDHGRMIWGETGRPGYGLYDRALGATYLAGLFEAVEKQNRRNTKCPC